MKRRDLSQQNLMAAVKTYTPSGKRDELLACAPRSILNRTGPGSSSWKGKVMKQAVMLALLMSVSPFAAAAADGAALYIEKTCIACHGPGGNKPLLPSYPRIGGQNAAYAEQQMRDIKSGARANGQTAAMKGIMHLVDDMEIKALAMYLESLK
jgi:cytochrome c